jgi:hypothetical protein
LSEASILCQKILTAFKERKGYKLAPSQAETRSKLMPSPALIKSIGLDYNNICMKVGLQPRFHYNAVEFNNNLDLKYFIDTREKKVLNLPVEQVKKLNYGDIAANKNPFGVFIERKSAPDLASTLTTNVERFKREIIRAQKAKHYLIVLCERPINEMLSIEYQNYMRFSYVKGEHLFHNIREICQEFNNIQFAFCKGRPHMIKVIESIYRCKSDPKSVDWEFLINTNKL